MAKVKVATLFVIALVLFSTLTNAARPEPALNSPSNAQKGNDADGVYDDNCEGKGEVEEECLTRRILAAHLDYIYTQKQNP